ncbi:CinA family protein [Arthrobacter sp. NEB 688]|uniref:CinA family protein n=1 Tax=Arthrobacter sp. NEB 688 TaxID=904039 RepID=UPI0015668833|nr:CinA family protein [Arthrobacter sp. NEB 688]QKE85267.1 hypothetical protein HL663_15855 [Arthrobacter sp. NEB 688]
MSAAVASELVGPDPADGRPVGTVFVAVAGPAGTAVEQHAFSGDRAQVRAASVTAALVLLAGTVRNLPADEAPARYRKATTDEQTSREEAP